MNIIFNTTALYVALVTINGRKWTKEIKIDVLLINSSIEFIDAVARDAVHRNAMVPTCNVDWLSCNFFEFYRYVDFCPYALKCLKRLTLPKWRYSSSKLNVLTRSLRYGTYKPHNEPSFCVASFSLNFLYLRIWYFCHFFTFLNEINTNWVFAG